MDDFLREDLARAKCAKTRNPVVLPRGTDMARMLVNIADRDRLYDVLHLRE